MTAPGSSGDVLVVSRPCVASGVGSRRSATASGVPIPFPLIPSARSRPFRPARISSDSPSFGFDAAGVGSSEPPAASMRGTDVGRP